MATNNLQSKLGLWLAQAQTANMDAAAYNRANASDPGRVQIEWGTSVGSQGTIGSQALSPASLSTPAAAPTIQASATPMAAASTATPSNPSITINNWGKSWSTPLGSSLVGTKTEKVKSESLPQTGTEWITTQQTTPALTLLQIRNQLKATNPNAAPLEIMRQARDQFNAQKNVLTPAPTKPEAQTWIAPLDAELAKLREEKAQKIKDTYKNYTLAQADYQKNAGYYTNFNETNSKFNQVVSDIQNTLTNSKTGTLSDQEIAVIAAKNGVSPEDVKNPLNVYNKLQMTEEWKLTLGVTARENQIADMQTENERQKEDAKVSLERNTQQLNYQIEDAQKQLQRNLDWATASGAWSGAARSSGYEQGIQNMKNDTATVVSRINEQIWNMNADNSKYLTRLNEDFTKNMGRAKESLDLDLKNLKFDSGLKLNGLEEKYGKGSKELLKALDAIQEEFGTKSLESFNKYLTSVKGIQEITMGNINLMDKMNTVSSALKNRRYGELTANNGALLQNTSLSSLMKEVQSGALDFQKYADARNLMISSVTNAVTAKLGTVTPEDLNVITHLIDNGATPAQVLAKFGVGDKSMPTIDPNSIATYSQQKRGRTNLQCGELANDYWQQMTGSAISHDPSINTYKGKVAAVKKLGESPIPVVWGVFTLDTGTPEGHIGIVQEVRSDGSIVVLEANREGSTKWGAPVLHVYTDTSKMTFSQAPQGTQASSGGNSTVTRGTTQNRPDRNNNPWNVKAWWNEWMNIPGATGIDDQNHIIFSNPTDGYNWMLKDLWGKLSGNNKWGLTPDSTLAQLGSIYAEDPNWSSNVAQIAGYSPDTKLSEIDVNKLAPAIARQEGFTGKVTQNTSPTQSSGTFTPYQEAGMLKFQKSGDPKDLAEVGISKDQYNAYVAQQKAKPVGKTGDFQKSEIEQFKAYNWNSIPEEYKTPEEKTAFLNRMSEWQSQGNLTKIEKDDIEKTRTNLESDIAYKAGLELMPKFKTLTGINQRLKDGSATPQDKQQLINDFAKILDPDSVVREGEYALAGKYSQSKIDTWKQEVKNFFTTGGPLSDDAAKMLAEGVDRRFSAIMTEYDSSIDRAIRNVKFKVWRDVPTDALQVEYSPMRSGDYKKEQAIVAPISERVNRIKNLISSQE